MITYLRRCFVVFFRSYGKQVRATWWDTMENCFEVRYMIDMKFISRARSQSNGILKMAFLYCCHVAAEPGHSLLLSYTCDMNGKRNVHTHTQFYFYFFAASFSLSLILISNKIKITAKQSLLSLCNINKNAWCVYTKKKKHFVRNSFWFTCFFSCLFSCTWRKFVTATIFPTFSISLSSFMREFLVLRPTAA